MHPDQEAVAAVGVGGRGAGALGARRVEHDGRDQRRRPARRRRSAPRARPAGRAGRRRRRCSRRPARRRPAAPSGARPWPGRAGAAGTSRRPPGRWRSWCWRRPRPARNRVSARTGVPPPPRAASAPAAVVATRPVTSSEPLAAAVGDRAPRHQGEHHARRSGPRRPGRPAASESPCAVVQHGDQEGRPVHHHRGRRLGQRARARASSSGGRRRPRPAAGRGRGRRSWGQSTTPGAARRAPSCLLTCEEPHPRVSHPRRPESRRTGRRPVAGVG